MHYHQVLPVRCSPPSCGKRLGGPQILLHGKTGVGTEGCKESTKHTSETTSAHYTQAAPRTERGVAGTD